MGVLLNGSFEIWNWAINFLKILRKGETFEKCPFYSISASGSNFNPRNIKYIPVVEIFAFLDLDQN